MIEKRRRKFETQLRCNHCGKWIEEYQGMVPTDKSDGILVICPICVDAKREELGDNADQYWAEWEREKLQNM